MEAKPKLKFKIKNVPTATKKKFNLNITKKPSNSPLLSIETFLKTMKLPIPIDSDFKQLWNKYQKQSIHSLIIEKHNLTPEYFQEVAEVLIATINYVSRFDEKHSEIPAPIIHRKNCKI